MQDDDATLELLKTSARTNDLLIDMLVRAACLGSDPAREEIMTFLAALLEHDAETPEHLRVAGVRTRFERLLALASHTRPIQ